LQLHAAEPETYLPVTTASPGQAPLAAPRATAAPQPLTLSFEEFKQLLSQEAAHQPEPEPENTVVATEAAAIEPAVIEALASESAAAEPAVTEAVASEAAAVESAVIEAVATEAVEPATEPAAVAAKPAPSPIAVTTAAVPETPAIEAPAEEPRTEAIQTEAVADTIAAEAEVVAVQPATSMLLENRRRALQQGSRVDELTQQAPAGDFDLPTAVARAVATHPSVARSFGQLYETLELVDVAKAGYYPTVGTTIGSNYRRDLDPRGTFSVSASQMLWDFGKVSSAVDAASSSADRNRAGVLKAIEDLSRETAAAFIEVQRGMALLDVARRQTAAIAEIEQLAEARSNVGASTRSDLLQARSRREASEALELQLQADLDLWKRTLQNYVGHEVPGLVSREFPRSLQRACEAPADFDNAPTVQAANAELAEARARISQAKANMFPTLSLSANYGNLSTPDITNFDLTSQRDLTFTLNINSTLFQGGARSARRRAAEYAVQASEAARATAVLEVSRSYREARDQTSSLSARLASLEERYSSIAETQQLYLQQYLSLGTRTLLDILNTEQEIHQSLFEQVHTAHDLRRLQVVCLHSVGGLRETLLPETRSALERGLLNDQ
jgi:adhesin transport system outer membrane protein